MPHYVSLMRWTSQGRMGLPAWRDDETALEIITKLGRHGAEETETLRAFTRDEAEEIIRRL
jgi:uncharacterized protein with GYD domain